MNKYIFSLIMVAAMFLFEHCTPKQDQAKSSSISVEVKNPTALYRNSTLVSVDHDDLKVLMADYKMNELAVFSDGNEIASQSNEDDLYFMVDLLNPNQQKEFTIQKRNPSAQPKFIKRTQAEVSVKKGGYFENRKYIGGDFQNVRYLRVPDEHTDHSFDIRYEGPGWESDLVGYRFYLDWRNATDVFGKKTSDMVLQEVGLDGFDSYHNMQPWGLDVLKVGKSLGIGTLAAYTDDVAQRVDNTDSVTCSILENGLVRSAILTNYYGWKVAGKSMDLESILSIHAGTRLTHHEIKIAGEPENLCTGIIKDKSAQLYTNHGNEQHFGYLATFGKQSLNDDHLGLAIFFSNENYKGFTEGEFSHVVKLNPTDNKLDYYFLAAWEGEKNGIKTEGEFIDYVKKTAKELANPVEIKLKKN